MDNEKNNYTARWKKFSHDYQLTENQLHAFIRYFELIIEYNQNFNLTALTSVEDVLSFHFEDSLKLSDFFDFSTCKGMADIGTGAGMPGIPLKILFPDLPVILIEVTQKKVDFLNYVIKELDLKNIEVCSFDWRTFLRKTHFSVDLFCARASLRPDELLRAFKESSFYKNATIVYWASAFWVSDDNEKSYITDHYDYCIKDRQRTYIMFKNKIL